MVQELKGGVKANLLREMHGKTRIWKNSLVSDGSEMTQHYIKLSCWQCKTQHSHSFIISRGKSSSRRKELRKYSLPMHLIHAQESILVLRGEYCIPFQMTGYRNFPKWIPRISCQPILKRVKRHNSKGRRISVVQWGRTRPSARSSLASLCAK